MPEQPIRKYTALRRFEKRLAAAAHRALVKLLGVVKGDLAAAGMNPDALDARSGDWAVIVDDVLPIVSDVYLAALREAADIGTVDATAYAARHLDTVRNRLVGVADTVFDLIRTDLRDGWLAGEDVAKLAARVDAFLADGQRWRNRAVTIARTEVIGANNAGAHDAAGQIASRLGVEHGAVAKVWLPTFDSRTRETHADMADTDPVIGLSNPFLVGGYHLMQPGDPSGPAAEVVNCRCTVQYLMPGDPGYPGGDTMTAPLVAARSALRAEALAAARRHASDDPHLAHAYRSIAAGITAAGPEDDPEPGQTEGDNTSTVIVALPAADDPVNDLVADSTDGAHATLLWFGDVDDATADAIRAAVEALTTDDTRAPTSPFRIGAGEVDSLGDDDPPAVVLLLNDDDPAVDDGVTLAGTREELLGDDAVRAAYEAVKQYPTFTPHITLGYGDEVSQETQDAAAALADVTFDRLAVWQGGDQQEYPLGDQAMTAAADTQPAPEVTADLSWSGVLMVEGVGTGDYRKINDGAIGWMNDPGTLFAMFDGGSGFGGHEDQTPVGVISSISREGNELRFNGTWSTSEDAAKARQMNIDGELRGVSADLDAVEWHLEDADGNPIEGDAIYEIAPDTEVWQVIDAARVRGATLWAIPAFVEAYVLDATVADEVPDTGWASPPADVPSPVAIAAAAATAPRAPSGVRGSAPASAFAYPGAENLHGPDGTPLGMVVTDDKRIFGYVATWGTCHIGFDGMCVTPPTSETDYGCFMTGDYPTSDGELVSVGQITMDTGHADLSLRLQPAVAHYDNTGNVAADIACGEDETGIWYAGVLRPDLTDSAELALRSSGRLSGDWREFRGNLEMVAALGVNVGGFPIPKVSSRVASGVQTSLVASGIVKAPAQIDGQAAFMSDDLVRRIASAVVATQKRQIRRDATLTRLRRQRQAATFNRLNLGGQ